MIDNVEKETLIDTVYIGVPSFGERGEARFANLSYNGKKALADQIKQFDYALGAGDILFELFVDDLTKMDLEKEGWLN